MSLILRVKCPELPRVSGLPLILKSTSWMLPFRSNRAPWPVVICRRTGGSDREYLTLCKKNINDIMIADHFL